MISLSAIEIVYKSENILTLHTIDLNTIKHGSVKNYNMYDCRITTI